MNTADTVDPKEAAEFAARMHSGQVCERDIWLRLCVTDIEGRAAPLAAEMIAKAAPVPWYSKWHKSDALAALPSVEPDSALRDQLSAWIKRTKYVPRTLGSWIEPFTHVGNGPYFHRGRAVWGACFGNPDFWLPTIENFMRRLAEGPPAIPFQSKVDRASWARHWREIEDIAAGEGRGIDLAEARKAIRRHPFLG